MASPSCRKVCRSQGNPVERGPSLAFTRRCRILVNPAAASCRCCCVRFHQTGRQATLVSGTDDVKCLIGTTGSVNWRSQGLQSGARHSSPTPAMLDPLPVQFGRQPGDAAVPPHPMHPSREGASPRPRPGYSPQAPSEDRDTSAGFCQVGSPRFDQRPPSAPGGIHQEVCPSPLQSSSSIAFRWGRAGAWFGGNLGVLLRWTCHVSMSEKR